MKIKSTISIAKLGTNSLRTTVPSGIVSYLDLQAGDQLEWKMELGKNNLRIGIVNKVSTSKK